MHSRGPSRITSSAEGSGFLEIPRGARGSLPLQQTACPPIQLTWRCRVVGLERLRARSLAGDVLAQPITDRLARGATA
jgi:hypothetical protein